MLTLRIHVYLTRSSLNHSHYLLLLMFGLDQSFQEMNLQYLMCSMYMLQEQKL